ncbi:MAG: hypothetical protein I3J02_05855 [Prevotella sp.]|nr:hypothetical protein [Prevotella sp.]
MNKTLLTIALCGLFSLNIHAQQIFNEVKSIQKNFLTIKQDKSKPLDERKVASFKWDAVEYMLYKAKDDSTFSERQLGQQTMAMTEFVNLYFKRLSEAQNKEKKDIAIARFKNASINNSLFQDMDKELVLAYYDNPKFTTPFSLDTDWVKALAEIRSKSWE